MLMYVLLCIIEALLLLAAIIVLAVFADAFLALSVSMALLLLVFFIKPAKRITDKLAQNKLEVVRLENVFEQIRAKMTKTVKSRPRDGLTPAEIYRLMEIIGAVPENRRLIAPMTAMLLDFNRRGFLAFRDADEGLRVALHVKSVSGHKLRAHEVKFWRFISGQGKTFSLSAFTDAVMRFPYLTKRKLRGVQGAVDRLLVRRGLLRRRIRPFGIQLSMTEKGEMAAALWYAYLSSISSHPYVRSYRPQTDEQGKFAKDIMQMLIDATAGGCAAQTAAALMREYVFEPQAIFDEGNYFAAWNETNIAFAGSKTGEDYFFLPLRDFETIAKEISAR